MLKKDVTKKMLVEIAAVLNKVMGYEKPIEVGRKVLRKDLYDEVADSAQDIEPADLENEAFTPDIVTWLKVIGWEAPAGGEAEDETEPEATKPKDTPEPKKEPGKKVGMAGTISRIEAAAKALENGGTKNDIAEAANDIYVDGGGKDNIKEAKWATKVMLDVVMALQVADLKDGKYTLTA